MSGRLDIEIKGLAGLAIDKARLKRTMRTAGRDVAQTAQTLLSRTDGSGRKYGKHQASAPGEAPAKITGALLADITSRVNRRGDTATIIDAASRGDAFYALMLEKGAKGGGSRKGLFKDGKTKTKNRGSVGRKIAVTARVLEPRPFLSMAVEQLEGPIADRIRAAILDGITYKRLAPTPRKKR